MRPSGMLRGALRRWGRGSRARWVVTGLVVAALAVVGASAALAETTSGGPAAGAGDAQVEDAVGAASLIASPNALPLLEGGTVLIAGAGLPPEEAVRVSVTDALGIRWDITGSVTPLPLIASTGGAIPSPACQREPFEGQSTASAFSLEEDLARALSDGARWARSAGSYARRIIRQGLRRPTNQ